MNMTDAERLRDIADGLRRSHCDRDGAEFLERLADKMEGKPRPIDLTQFMFSGIGVQYRSGERGRIACMTPGLANGWQTLIDHSEDRWNHFSDGRVFREREDQHDIVQIIP